MTTFDLAEPDRLARLLALVEEALALSDSLELHAIGIALDGARVGVETALADLRGPSLHRLHGR